MPYKETVFKNKVDIFPLAWYLKYIQYEIYNSGIFNAMYYLFTIRWVRFRHRESIFN